MDALFWRFSLSMDYLMKLAELNTACESYFFGQKYLVGWKVMMSSWFWTPTGPNPLQKECLNLLFSCLVLQYWFYSSNKCQMRKEGRRNTFSTQKNKYLSLWVHDFSPYWEYSIVSITALYWNSWYFTTASIDFMWKNELSKCRSFVIDMIETHGNQLSETSAEATNINRDTDYLAHLA